MSIAGLGWKKVTIADSASLSGAISVYGMRLVAIHQPASCEGVTFSFQASFDGGTTFVDLYFGQVGLTTVEYSVAKSATLEQFIMLTADVWLYGMTNLKVRTGLTAAPTTQTGAAVIDLCFEDVAVSYS